MFKTVILIPSRLSATRLPRKPLLKINGISIISHVVKKAQDADIGEVFVATEDKEILDDVSLNGGKAIITSNKHKTGSDRIFECFEKLNLKDIEYIINLQGDEPNIDINDLKHLNKLIELNKPEIGTLASNIEDKSKLNKSIFHHIGVYGFQKQFLKDYVSQKPTSRELEEKLEQLRVLENTKIGITIIEREILGVDTKEDLDRVNQLIQDNE